MMLNTADKVRENRLRRMAQRQGLEVIKSRRRDPLAVDHGYMVLKIATETVLSPPGPGSSPFGLADLDALESWLLMPPEQRPVPGGGGPEQAKRAHAAVAFARRQQQVVADAAAARRRRRS